MTTMMGTMMAAASCPEVRALVEGKAVGTPAAACDTAVKKLVGGVAGHTPPPLQVIRPRAMMEE